MANPEAPRRVILTGATGFLGRALRRAFDAVPGWEVHTLGRGPHHDAECDLAGTDERALVAAVEGADVVVHAAALSSMGDCARDPELAARVNTAAAIGLSRAARRIVHVSTDLVFDGRSAPYLAGAAPKPSSVYGETKARAEDGVLAACPDALVVRLPLLFGPSHDGRRGATDMLRGPDIRKLGLFVDEFRTPLHVDDAAAALVALSTDETRRGVVHVAGPERISREAFGRRFLCAVGAWTGSPPFGAAWSGGRGGRPRDVAMLSDVRAPRSLDEALASS